MKVLVPPVYMPDPSKVFRPDVVIEETGWNFRKYDPNSKDPTVQLVYKTYLQMHSNQTVQFVNGKIDTWGKFNRFKAGIVDALDLLNSFVDESDPDLNLPNIVHAYQTAERIREVHPDKDWMHLVGLIHDLGKVLCLYGEPQWAVVGDTFPVGCAIAPSVVLKDSTFHENADMKDPRYNTTNGMYKPNCGLDNVLMSWGHDEYMYRVLKHNKSTLPQIGLDMVRYHSFFPWHTGGDYMHLCDENDKERLIWIREFNKFDLYTKREDVPDIEALKPYYQGLVDKYCPGIQEF